MNHVLKNDLFLNRLYSIAFCIQIVVFFLRSTLIGEDYLGRMNVIFGRTCTSFVYVSILMILFKVLLEHNTINLYKDFSVVIFFLVAYIYMKTNYLEVMAATTLILGAKGVDYYALSKKFFIVGSSLTIITVLLSLFNVIVNISFYKNGVNTYALGFVYPTDFAAHMLTLALAYYVYRIKYGISYLSILVTFFLTIIIYKITYARNDFVCMLILIVFILIYKLINDFNFFKKNGVIKSVYNKCILKIYSLSLLIVSILSFILAYSFDASSKFWAMLNSMFTGRIYFSNEALRRYPLNFIGYKVSENGYGGINGIDNASHYFFIDQSVIRIFIMYGLIISTLFILGYTVRMYKLCLNGNALLLSLFAIFSLYCFIDFRIYDPSYNVFIPIVFATLKVNDINRNEQRGINDK